MSAKSFSFNTENGTDEFYLVVTPDRVTAHYESQLDEVFRLYHDKLNEMCLAPDSAIWATVYLSDCMNQEQQLRQNPAFVLLAQHAALSVYEGKPCGSKIAILAYHIRPYLPLKKRAVVMDGLGHSANGVAYGSGALEHIVIKNILPSKGQAMTEQANDLFGQVAQFFGGQKLPMSSLIRTWIYIRDIDKDYGEMVSARKLFFQNHGLTQSTGFPASTGIEGLSKDPNHLILMDSFIIRGAKSGQIRRMQALSHLCSTVDYGVTFERGLEVVYGDRRHFYISGTASISSDGRILHEGDVVQQAKRTVENMTALLENHGAELNDMAYFVVYIRDLSDGEHVRTALNSLLPPHLPYLIVVGKVCRPGWLIEIEGIGISNQGVAEFPPY